MKVDQVRSAIQGAGNRRVLDAWLRWRGARLLPQRRDLEIGDIAADLPYVGIAEVLPSGDVLVRVAGTALRRIYGVELTGRNVKDFTASADWPLRWWRYQRMVTRPCGSFYTRRDVLEGGRIVVYESVGLPLDTDGTVDRRQLLWSLVPLDETFTLDPTTAARTVPLATSYAFIDIGAGEPEADGP